MIDALAIPTKKRPKHGFSDTPTHTVWMSLFYRCNNPKADSYKYYGGRGIKVCERWNEFKNFLEDMGVRPSGSTIDRIDSFKDYKPGNCRWVTNKQQQNNRTNNVTIEWRGERKTVAEWADIVGIKYSTIYFRIRHGWSAEHTLTLPLAERIKYKSRVANGA